MIRLIARAVGAAFGWIDRVLGVDTYIHRHVDAALTRGDAEFERACRDAITITRDGLPIPTTTDIDRMIHDIEAHLRYSDRGGNAT